MAKKIIIIGTSHISPESVEKARKTILKQKPDCLAVELCYQRYSFLLSPREPKLSQGLLYYVLYHLQQALGKTTGILPGTEMLTAIKAGKKVKARIVFIDKHISEISYELSRVPFFERMRLIFTSIFGFAEQKISPDNLDLKKVPPKKIIRQGILYLKKEFPTFYKILIKDRNKYMANRIKELLPTCKKMVVVVGAGHENQIKKLIKRRKT